jgi:uncharacterized protein YbaR (Trm112 family)
MSILITCPGCRGSLKVPETARGKTLRCPTCQHVFTLPEAEPPIPVEEVLPVEEESPVTSPTDSLHVDRARAYAEAAGINLEEDHNESVDTKREADKVLKDWKSDFPPVPSAYQPSGVLPIAAVLWMSVGAVIGVPTGLLAGGLVALIVGLIVGLIGLVVHFMGAICNVVFCIIPLFGGLIALIGFGLIFGAQGYTSAACTTAMGTLGKNRNGGAAALFSIISAVIGVMVVGVALGQIKGDVLAVAWWDKVIGESDKDMDQLTKEAEQKEGERRTANWVNWIALLIGGVISVISAAVGATQMVAEAKFCEDCEEYMAEKELVNFRLGGIRALAQAMEERNIPVCHRLMHAPTGPTGMSRLHWCEKCHKGFLELKVNFKAKWTDKDSNQEKTESWLAGSIDLTPDEVNLFKPYGKKA